MEKWLYKMEYKYGKYAIRNLPRVLVFCYMFGYMLDLFFPGITEFLYLNPYLILHGQLWRLFSWVLIPPESLSIFTVIMLLCYYSLGTSLEHAWGSFRFNVYMLSGMLFTIIGSFIVYGIANVEFAELISSMGENGARTVFTTYDVVFQNGQQVALPAVWFMQFSTYYINLSILLAFAVTYPDVQFLMMFLIPIKAKYIAVLDILLLAMEFFSGGLTIKVIIVASILNFLLFFFGTKSFRRISPSQIKRKAEFQKKMREAQRAGNEATYQGRNVITRHKCAICGRTELDDENLEFRFCSKCEGNYEYCMDHLYTHEHVKRIVPGGHKNPEE